MRKSLCARSQSFCATQTRKGNRAKALRSLRHCSRGFTPFVSVAGIAAVHATADAFKSAQGLHSIAAPLRLVVPLKSGGCEPLLLRQNFSPRGSFFQKSFARIFHRAREKMAANLVAHGKLLKASNDKPTDFEVNIGQMLLEIEQTTDLRPQLQNLYCSKIQANILFHHQLVLRQCVFHTNRRSSGPKNSARSAKR